MYEHIHSITMGRTQSSPSDTRPRHYMSSTQDLLPRPWSDTDRVKFRPRQLEPLVTEKHIKIPQQRGMTGLHLSCNYTSTQWRATLNPLVTEQGQGQLETHEEDDSDGGR